MAEQTKNENTANAEATAGAEETKQGGGAKKTATKQTKNENTAKVYKFKSANKFLSCVALGVQFINGEATTDRIEVARELVKIDGVELVEE